MAGRDPMVWMALLAVVACGPSGDDSGADGSSGSAAEAGEVPAGFAACCVAILETEVALMEPFGAGGWSLGDETAGPGTEFLLATDGSRWDGYVLAGGEVTRKVADREIEAGVDFTADCATDPQQVETKTLLLRDATFYPSMDLSGPPCTISAGTPLVGNYGFALVADGVGQVTGDTLSEACDLQVAYTPDMITADLVAASS